jgi:exosortase A
MTVYSKSIERRSKLDLIPLFFFLAAFGLLYWKTVYGMVVEWCVDENYSHGFLIPLISGYLVWQKREEIQKTEAKPANLGILIFFAGLACCLVGNVAGESFTMRISLLVVLAGALLFCCGATLFKKLSFPFFYLVFMIPLPYILYDAVAFPLKLFVSKYSVEFLKIIGVPVYREGNVINLVNTSLEVADACSGIRSIVSLLAMAAALAYFAQKGWVRRTVLVALAVPIAMFANGIRVIGTGILATHFGAKVAEGFFHEFAGLVIFGIAMALLILSSFILAKIGADKHE